MIFILILLLMFTRLRNKKGNVPKIVEKTKTLIGGTDIVGSCIGSIVTVDGKNSLIVALINNKILIFC